MKIKFINFYFVLFLAGFSCAMEEKKTMITIACNACAGVPVTLSTANILLNTPKDIYHENFPSSGTAHIQLDNTDTLDLFLTIGENDKPKIISTHLYLEPGTNIDILFQNGILTFQGDLARVSLYRYKMLGVDVKRADYINANGQQYMKVSDVEKEFYLATIRSFGEELNQMIVTDGMLSEFYKRLLVDLNSSSEIMQRLAFDFQKDFIFRNANENNVLQNPVNLNVFSELDLNLSLSRNALYLFFLRQNLSLGIQDLWEYYDENEEEMKVSRYELTKSAIKMNPKLVAFQDLILALCLTQISGWEWVVYEDLQKFAQSYEHDYPSSKYLTELREVVGERDKLRTGMPMKDFVMHDVAGKAFKLSSLKGNLIYIDVWATWCGPCRDELKYSAKLSKKYAGRADLKFLYTSVDKDHELWMRFLEKNNSLKGIHGIQSPRNTPLDSTSIMELYKINGIPRYILIDKGGRIVDYNAARPSVLLKTKYLDSLLAR